MKIKKLLTISAVCLSSVAVQAQEPVRMEYFLDTDPGKGKDVAVSLPNDHSESFAFEVPVDNLSSGKHLFWVRAKNTYGEWSVLRSTSVEVIELSGINDAESATKLEDIYDLQGHRLTQEQLSKYGKPRRIFIIDGRKVIMK